MPQETEIKLRLDPEQVETFMRGKSLRRLRSGHPKSKSLLSTYYDTPDLRLRKAGLTLRVRQIGGGFVQTVKGAAKADSPYSRLEIETALPNAEPNLRKAKKVERLLDGAPVAPLFETRIDRKIWILEYQGSQIECALDIGGITSPRAESRVCEVELELLSGKTLHLFDAAKALSEDAQLCLDLSSKAERGYLLAAGLEPAARKLRPLRLKRGQSVRLAFAAILRHCLVHILAHEALARRGGDPQGVHQTRVGLRQLRAALSLFKPVLPEPERSAFAERLKALQAELGPARDLDVFMAETFEPLRKVEPQEPDFLTLEDRLHAARLEAYARVDRVLSSRAFSDILLDLEIWAHCWTSGEETGGAPPFDLPALGEPIEDFAAAVLKKRWKAMRKDAAGLETLGEEQLHRLRIDLKKMRYGVDFFGSLYPSKSVKQSRAKLKSLQDVMGEINDAATHWRMLPQFAPGLGRGEALIQGWTAGRAQAARSRVFELWGELEKIRLFWA